MSLYPGEIVIHDGNVQLHKQAPSGQGFGLIPRNYNTHPVGCYGAILPYHAVTFPLIPRDEWAQRIKDQITSKARLSDIRMIGNNGQPVPALDQNGKGFCWAHSGTSAVMMLRAQANLPYVGLSAYAVACIIKDYRDEGGWGAQGVDFIASRGVPSEKFWPMQSMSRANDKPETWDNAKLHRITEGWIDLAAAQYDRNLSWDQEITMYLSGFPVVKDESWWSHSICGLDVVDGNTQFGSTRAASGKLLTVQEHEEFWGVNNPVTAGYGVRILNSWGNSWSTLGMGVLTGNQAISDGAVAPLVTGASVA